MSRRFAAYVRGFVAAAAIVASAGVVAADPSKVYRIAFPVAETSFDPARVSDLYSNTVNEAIFERLLTFRPQLAEERGPDGMLDIAAIAESYWFMHHQHRSAWTLELDVRPWAENF